MHNPLSLLFPQLLDRLVEHGYRYFVRQSFPRGIDLPAIKEAFLITPYLDFGEANAHFQAIRFDHRKYIYPVDHHEEKAKLYAAAGQPEGYRVFVALLKGKTWRPPPDLGPRIKAFLKAQGRGSSGKIDAVLGIHFGELILEVRAGEDTFKVPLREIDNA
ncbi:hypothetical protein [Chitinophaga sp. YIM B06452]|uniref:hypothetical protein n=1 Tax=Chitinophaga sp. YIM B06452 TaxID=3082158 RepID=UPI0031FEF997